MYLENSLILNFLNRRKLNVTRCKINLLNAAIKILKLLTTTKIPITNIKTISQAFFLCEKQKLYINNISRAKIY